MFYLFHGADEFTAHEELARLRDSGGFDYNQDTFSGDDADLGQLRATCDTLPFLSERRLVVLQGLPKRKRGAKGDTDDADSSTEAPTAKGGKGKKSKGGDPKAFSQALADYAPQLPETTTLVVFVEELLEATNPLVKAARQYGKERVFPMPKGASLEDWLTRRAKSRDARLTPDAMRLLVESVGDNLRMLASEIDKLSAYVGASGQIRVEDVRALTPMERQSRVFDLTDALARRDRSRALALLHELLANGESPLGIVALTAFQTRALLQVKTLSDRGMRPMQIAQVAGLAPFVVEKTLPLARQFTFVQLEAAHRSLLDVDTALKRSRMTPDMALDLFVIEFGT